VQPAPSIVVFCDLDDTLFEPHAFAGDASTHGALSRIEHAHVPLVFSSSKTRAEIELIQQEIGINQPFICENGAALFVPRGYFGFRVEQARHAAGYEVVEFGKPYAEVVASLHGAACRLDMKIVGFSDMSVEDVAIDCDLSMLQARLAKLREYNEHFRVVDDKRGALPRLFKALRAADLTCTRRGAYYHVGAIHREHAGRFLGGLYRRAFGQVVTVAFADHRGATPLLRSAEMSLVVASSAPDEMTYLLTHVPRARLTVADSVGAWAEVILEIAGAAQRDRSACSS
jgi:mannosyl-3-phosphoglycerate phosphatase